MESIAELNSGTEPYPITGPDAHCAGPPIIGWGIALVVAHRPPNGSLVSRALEVLYRTRRSKVQPRTSLRYFRRLGTISPTRFL
jgi:hypothetical protein